MELIVLSKGRGHLGHLRLTSRRVWVGITCLALAVCAGFFFGGYQAATYFGIVNPDAQVAAWREDLNQQQAMLEATRRAAQQNLDALALRLGQMNAHVVRLDALGARLTQMAGLDDGEFDFSSAPSLGGPEEPLASADRLQISGLITALDSLGGN